MSDFNLTINTQELERIVRELAGGHLDEWLRGFVEEGVTEMKLSMGDSPSGGREYWRGNTLHIASLPQFPPNVDTGTLRASLHSEKVSDSEYLIADGVEYGEFLEYGTEYMHPRPFMRPVINAMRREIMEGDAGEDIIP